MFNDKNLINLPTASPNPLPVQEASPMVSGNNNRDTKINTSVDFTTQNSAQSSNLLGGMNVTTGLDADLTPSSLGTVDSIFKPDSNTTSSAVIGNNSTPTTSIKKCKQFPRANSPVQSPTVQDKSLKRNKRNKKSSGTRNNIVPRTLNNQFNHVVTDTNQYMKRVVPSIGPLSKSKIHPKTPSTLPQPQSVASSSRSKPTLLNASEHHNTYNPPIIIRGDQEFDDKVNKLIDLYYPTNSDYKCGTIRRNQAIDYIKNQVIKEGVSLDNLLAVRQRIKSKITKSDTTSSSTPLVSAHPLVSRQQNGANMQHTHQVSNTSMNTNMNANMQSNIIVALQALNRNNSNDINVVPSNLSLDSDTDIHGILDKIIEGKDDRMVEPCPPGILIEEITPTKTNSMVEPRPPGILIEAITPTKTKITIESKNGEQKSRIFETSNNQQFAERATNSLLEIGTKITIESKNGDRKSRTLETGNNQRYLPPHLDPLNPYSQNHPDNVDLATHNSNSHQLPDINNQFQFVETISNSLLEIGPENRDMDSKKSNKLSLFRPTDLKKLNDKLEEFKDLKKLNDKVEELKLLKKLDLTAEEHPTINEKLEEFELLKKLDRAAEERQMKERISYHQSKASVPSEELIIQELSANPRFHERIKHFSMLFEPEQREAIIRTCWQEEIQQIKGIMKEEEEKLIYQKKVLEQVTILRLKRKKESESKKEKISDQVVWKEMKQRTSSTCEEITIKPKPKGHSSVETRNQKRLIKIRLKRAQAKRSKNSSNNALNAPKMRDQATKDTQTIIWNRITTTIRESFEKDKKERMRQCKQLYGFEPDPWEPGLSKKYSFPKKYFEVARQRHEDIRKLHYGYRNSVISYEVLTRLSEEIILDPSLPV